MIRPAQLDDWPQPHDPSVELDWSDPVLSRRLLREHLDQSHDSASRRPAAIARHVRRLCRLLGPPPLRILDAACGPGLYSVELAELGYTVTGVDVGPAVIAHARRLARDLGLHGHCDFQKQSLLDLTMDGEFDAAVVIYHVLEGFPRRSQLRVLRRLRRAIRVGGRLIIEMRTEPNHPIGRTTSWERAEHSLLSDRPHLLLGDSVYDDRTNTYVLRETAVFDDGQTARQQTTSQFVRLERLPRLLASAGFRLSAAYEGWSRQPADELSVEVVAVARAVNKSR